MARSSIWDGAQWVSMTGGAGDGGGGTEPDDNYLRLDAANNNPSPNNFLRKVDADVIYLPLVGGTISGDLTVNGNLFNGAMRVTTGGTLRYERAGNDSVYANQEADGRLRWWIPGRELFAIEQNGNVVVTNGILTVNAGHINASKTSSTDPQIYFGGAALFRSSGLGHAYIYPDAADTSDSFLVTTDGGIQATRQGSAHFVALYNQFKSFGITSITTTAAPNIHGIGISGQIQRSTSVVAAMSASEEAALDARMGGASIKSVTLESTNFATVMNKLLDRIEALEAHHP